LTPSLTIRSKPPLPPPVRNTTVVFCTKFCKLLYANFCCIMNYHLSIPAVTLLCVGSCLRRTVEVKTCDGQTEWKPCITYIHIYIYIHTHTYSRTSIIWASINP
jgi:hypothetical protein